jgi:hypothetical protein
VIDFFRLGDRQCLRAVLALLLAAGTLAWLSGCSQGIIGAESFAARPTNTPITTAEQPPPSESSAPSQCYYAWATQELPDVSRQFLEVLSGTDSGAKGSAYAFGEDCIHEDGSREFHAIETDFRVQVEVEDITDTTVLGDWILRLTPTVVLFSSSDLPGTHHGRVEFHFQTGSGDVRRLNVELDRFINEAGDLKGAALFSLFDNSQ